MGKSGNPAKTSLPKGTITWYSNSPQAPTGYGTQTAQVTARLKREGLDVAIISNYGNELPSSWDSGFGVVPIFQRGFEVYSNDIAPIHHSRWTAKHPKQKSVFISLYDSWVFKNKAWDRFPIASWTPIDHSPVPPKVAAWLKKDNVTPIAMSRFGQDEIRRLGIDCEYAPHAFEPVFKPTPLIEGLPNREWMKISDDAFVVGINAANKGVMPNRKAFGEAFMAFSIFALEHSDAVLYVHADPFGLAGGINLLNLAQACGINEKQIMFVDPVEYRYGYSQEVLAGIYSACDIGLTISLGEGFGLATIEFQACGVPVITSNFAASAELAGPQSFLVDGQPLWDALQDSWFQIPSVPGIVDALKLAYKNRGQNTQNTLDWVAQYSAETVFRTYWQPLIQKLLG